MFGQRSKTALMQDTSEGFCLGATSSDVWVIFLALHAGISPGDAQGPYEMLGIEQWLALCEAGAVLSLQPLMDNS